MTSTKFFKKLFSSITVFLLLLSSSPLGSLLGTVGGVSAADAPTITSTTYDQINKTVIYTFSEPVQLVKQADDPELRVVTQDPTGLVKIYTAESYINHIVWEAEPAPVGWFTTASFNIETNALTIQYTDDLPAGSYLADTWSYTVTDLENNQLDESNGNAIFTVDKTAPIMEPTTVNWKTITYTFSEPVQLVKQADNQIDRVITPLANNLLGIYSVDTSYNYGPKENVSIDASLTGNVLTVTYDGNLEKTSNTNYVIDARGYDITDLAWNKIAKEELTNGLFLVATTLPTAAISYSTTNITNQNVVVTLNPSEPIQEPLQYVYSGNGDYTITFTDLAGNVGSVVAHIANIDKDWPTATVTQVGDTITYRFNEAVQLRDNGWISTTITPNKLGIYVIDASGNYGLDTKVTNDITSATLDATNTILTIKYTWSLIKTATTNYVVDARGYRITDAVNNKMLASPTNVFAITGVPATPTQNIIPVATWWISITIQTGTSMTVGGVLTPFTSFPTPTYSTITPSTFTEANATIQWVVDLNFVGGAEFSKPIKIDIPVVGVSSVYIKANHGLWFGLVWLTTNPNATCTAWIASSAYAGGVISVVSGKATIYTCSASSFAAYNVSTPASNWGGGSITKDTCPNGDNSASYYDNSCGATTVVVKSSSGEVESNLLSGDTEEDAAYKFAFEKGITTMKSIKDADMKGNLTRGQMAKMMVNYAINVLGKTINTGAVCEFADNTKQSTEMKEYAIKACQLGLMGKNTKKFMPTSIVTRAELATVLSRMLYNTEDSGSSYYVSHLKVLKDKGVITNDNPKLKETRGYVMLMLKRAVK